MNNYNNNRNQKKLNYDNVFLNKEEVIILIENFRFLPKKIYVHLGTKLIWKVKQNKSQYQSIYDNNTDSRFFIISIP
jgi:hypothetical protein